MRIVEIEKGLGDVPKNRAPRESLFPYLRNGPYAAEPKTTNFSEFEDSQRTMFTSALSIIQNNNVANVIMRITTTVFE